MDIEELLQIERRGWQSLCDGSGDKFYGELMTATAVMVLANGAVMNRDDVIRSLADAPTWDEYRIEDPRLIEAGADTGILVYRGIAARRSDPEPFAAVMTSTYVRTVGGLRLAAYQQTPTVTRD